MLRRNVRRTAVAILAMAPVLVITACGDDSSSSDTTTTAGSSTAASSGDAGGASGQPIAAVIKGLDNLFFQTMQQGIEAGADAAGVTVEIQAAQSITDTTGQAERLAALAQQDFGCFIVNPITGNNLVQGLAQIAQKDVPVVNIDRPIDADAAEAAGVDIATYIGTDNVEAAELAGQRMVEQLGGTGQVAIIGGVAGDVTSNDRVTGFTNAAQDSLELLPVIAADWNRQQALTTATDLMTANPDLKGIFAANDDMALGAARAVANAGKTDQITVIGLDGNEDALQAVQAGELDATVAQYPYAVGELGVQACEAALAGQTLPENVKAPVALITSDNVSTALENFPQPVEEYDNPLETTGS
ncbi:sugar ABC transporter substrate-binding protein [Nakamurella leprariae]|uniref:Substrate-binding domain-containing protein n=1 Tax=Nakamurella leprariae TaxID=2803911 RepID=A0A938YD60_9ACTN|nr:substrate-binding domain-containing protein [Nakamurella leprariae]MBM9467428.1 substrate-binding domain-containing protein [Nakamurella leprariae]